MQTVPQANKAYAIRALLLVFAAVAPLLSILLIGAHLAVAFVPLFVSHLLLLYPTLVANCQWWGPVMTRFRTAEREVWLTIDDGPSPTDTLKILEILKTFDAKATFFVIGERAEKYPHLITEILAQGHALANHTHAHPSWSFWCLGPRRIAREIAACAETLRTTAERPAIYFRAPAGMKNFFVHSALAHRGLLLIGWTVRGLDTIGRDPLRVAERVEKDVVPGAIILLHEGKRTKREADFNPRCVELILQRLTARDYRFVIPNPEHLL